MPASSFIFDAYITSVLSSMVFVVKKKFQRANGSSINGNELVAAVPPAPLGSQERMCELKSSQKPWSPSATPAVGPLMP